MCSNARIEGAWLYFLITNAWLLCFCLRKFNMAALALTMQHTYVCMAHTLITNN